MFVFFYLFSQGPFSTFHIQNEPNIEWTGVKFSSDGKMILLSASGGVIHLIDAFQGTQLHTFIVSKVKKTLIGFLAFISVIIFFRVCSCGMIGVKISDPRSLGS